MEYLFYFSAVMCGYSYFLYPLILKCIRSRPSVDCQQIMGSQLPKLSLIITVHNEADRIREKLDNSLSIDYPKNQIEIIVASDCSTDDTDSITESYHGRGVYLVRADEHKGKEYAQLCAIRQSKGSILVFSDVATRIPPEALLLLASHFADARVGALSSEDQFVGHDLASVTWLKD